MVHSRVEVHGMLSWFKKEMPRWRTLLWVAAACSVELVSVWRYQGTQGLTSDSRLGVNEVVTQLKSELEQMEAQREAGGVDPLFTLHDFDVELAFVVSQDATQRGKIEYQVVTAEMERKFGTQNTHKVVLHMQLAPPKALPAISPTSALDAEGATRLP